jgi:hypothetical protein
MNAFIKLLYAILIAVSVVIFTSISIYSFYQPPKAPEYPTVLRSPVNDDKLYQNQQETYSQTYDQFREKEKHYQGNVAIAVLPVAAIITLFGLRYMKRNEVIGEGLALGGIANSIYSVVLASMADARIIRFLGVSLLLASALLLTQQRFAPSPKKSKK